MAPFGALSVALGAAFGALLGLGLGLGAAFAVAVPRTRTVLAIDVSARVHRDTRRMG
jgi:hypothetical protein